MTIKIRVQTKLWKRHLCSSSRNVLRGTNREASLQAFGVTEKKTSISFSWGQLSIEALSDHARPETIRPLRGQLILFVPLDGYSGIILPFHCKVSRFHRTHSRPPHPDQPPPISHPPPPHPCLLLTVWVWGETDKEDSCVIASAADLGLGQTGGQNHLEHYVFSLWGSKVKKTVCSSHETEVPKLSDWKMNDFKLLGCKKKNHQQIEILTTQKSTTREKWEVTWDHVWILITMCITQYLFSVLFLFHLFWPLSDILGLFW